MLKAPALSSVVSRCCVCASAGRLSPRHSRCSSGPIPAIFDTQWQTTMQREVPREVLSRVSAYDWFGSLVLLPLGYAIVGPVASVLGIHAVFIIGSAYLLVAVAVILFIPSVRQMRAGTGAT